MTGTDRLIAIAGFSCLMTACPAPRLTPITINPDSACRISIELGGNGEASFPPLSFSPDGRFLAAATDPGAANDRPVVDGQIWVYDLEHADRVGVRIDGTAKGGYYYARWSPDGATLAVVTLDHVDLVTPSGFHLRNLPGPLGMELSRLAYGTDGQTLAVAGNDDVLFFLDVASSRLIDGDVFHTRITDIEPRDDGFVVFHQRGDKLRRSFIVPGRRPERMPDLEVKAEGTITVFDSQDVVVHDVELGARLIVRTQEYLLLPGVRGGGPDLLVNADGFRLSRDRRRLAFAKVSCGQSACTGSLRVMQCTGLPPATPL